MLVLAEHRKVELAHDLILQHRTGRTPISYKWKHVMQLNQDENIFEDSAEPEQGRLYLAHFVMRHHSPEEIVSHALEP